MNRLPFPTKVGLHYLSIFLVALTLRRLHATWFEAIPFFNYPIVDSKAYHEWAVEIAAGNWVGSRPFYQAPLYPYFLALIYTVFGESLNAVRWVQSLLGATAACFMASATTLFFNRRAGYIAGWLVAFWPTSIFLDTLIQKSALDNLLFSLLFVWLGLYCRLKSPWFCLAGGVTAGILTLSRENALLLLPALALWILWQSLPGKQFSWRSALVPAIAFTASFAAILIPVAIRNGILGAPGAVTTWQMGSNFYIGNGAIANGSYVPILPDRGSTEFEQLDARAVAEQRLGKPLEPMEISRFWMKETFTEIAADPARWVALIIRKMGLTINNRESVDTDDIYFYEQFSPLLRFLNSILTFGLLFPLAVYGMVVVPQNYRWTSGLLLIAAVMVLSLVAFYVVSRYRHALTLTLFPFAAVGVTQLRASYYNSPRRALLGLALAGFATVLSHLPLIRVENQLAASYRNAAGAASEQNRLLEANQYFARALEADPDHAPTLLNAAAHSIKAGNPEQSKALLEAAQLHGAAGDKVVQTRGDLALSQGEPEIALHHYLEAKNLGAPEPAISNSHAAALIALGQHEEARKILLDLINNYPNYTTARRNLERLPVVD